MSFCASKYCQYNQRPTQMTSPVICPLCKVTQYCSIKCREYDWTSMHKLLCKPQTMGSEVTTLKQMKRSPEEFEIVQNGGNGGNLGRGSYGQVKLVKDKKNGLLYAMKIMNKREIFEYCSIDNLKREIRIQKKLDHPHVTKLFHYFEDKEHVYLILEYAQNGSLFGHLRRCKQFPENEAFVYFFQTCLGIDYLHKKHIIHRDLKPENLLLDEGGNIKICDFGWSAESMNGNQKRTTFCGTIDYMAPEMIENKPHDHTLDLWCLGILLYELLHGRAPFKGRNDIEKCNNIVRGQKIEFDINVRQDARDIISDLLRPLPQERTTMLMLFKHPWMQRIAKIYQIDIQSYVYVESSWQMKLAQSTDVINHHKSVSYNEKDQQFSNASTNTKDTLYKSEYHPSNQQKNQNISLETSYQSEDNFYKGRVSKQSVRNRNVHQEIQPPLPRKELGPLDKFFISLGCMKRE